MNGSWEFAAAQKGEAALSGVGRHEDHVWYRRNFTVSSKWGGKRVLLHFGAVNWETTVYVNGKSFPAHKGGYDEWTLDITDALAASGPQEIVVGVDNLVDANPGQAIGTQRLKPGGILYTAATGIWQTVWLEPVSTAHIGNLDLTPDIDSNALRVTVTPEAPDNVRIKATQVKITALDRGKVVGEATGDASAWKTGPAGFGHDSNSVRTEWTTDDIWIRREIDLPANLPAKLAVSIIHGDDAQVYINGVLAADAPDYAGQYTDIAMTDAGRAALKPGKNVIAVHCHNRVGGQFIDMGIVKAGAVANVQR
ncbi:MAG: sugar-binding domain-containing protein [Capsulimonas sp.]